RHDWDHRKGPTQFIGDAVHSSSSGSQLLRSTLGACAVSLFDTAPPACALVYLDHQTVRVDQRPHTVSTPCRLATACAEQAWDEASTCHLNEHRPGLTVFAFECFTCGSMGVVWNSSDLCKGVAFGVKCIGCRNDAWCEGIANTAVDSDLGDLAICDQMLDLDGTRCRCEQ